MKKKLVIIFFGILSGILLAIPVFVAKTTTDNNLVSLYVLQVGVFESEANALDKQKEVTNSVVYASNNYYYVFAGASTSMEGINKIASILDSQNISYYLKNIYVTSDDLLWQYNEMLEKASNEETIIFLSEKILESVSNNEL